MEKWEYQILSINSPLYTNGWHDSKTNTYVRDPTQELNRLGAEGWELVSVTTAQEGSAIDSVFMKAFFKRRIA